MTNADPASYLDTDELRQTLDGAGLGSHTGEVRKDLPVLPYPCPLLVR